MRVTTTQSEVHRLLLMACAVMALPVFGAVSSGVVRFHGAVTPLRTVLESEPSGFLGGDVWTYGQTAVSIHARPRVDSDKELRPMWIWHHELPRHNQKSVGIFKQSTFVLVMQLNSDPTVCLVNVLSGRRVLSESPKLQDGTTDTIPCSNVTATLPLAELPRQALDEINELLAKAGSNEAIAK